MPGQIKRCIDSIQAQRAKGNPTLLLTTRTKLILKGVNPDRFDGNSPDDERALAQLRTIAEELARACETSKEPTAMSIRTANTDKPLPEAICELRDQLHGIEPRVVLFFASDNYDAAAVSRQMQCAFPAACVTGCSTAGELAGGRLLNGSISAMFLDRDVVEDAAVVVLENLSERIDVRSAMAQLERHFGVRAGGWDLEKYAGLVLVDGLSGAEERLMEKLGDVSDLTFVGGSAGDDSKFQRTHVYANGLAYTDSAVLALLRLRRGFEIVKTQSFRRIGKSLVATAVEGTSRTVSEFNGKPALAAYAEALGVTPEEAAKHFFEHPLGLMVNGEPFVRSPQRADGGKMVFYCGIQQGTELEVLKATDIVPDTRRAIEERKAVMGEIRGLIDFHCILRTIQLRNQNRGDDYAAIFAGIPAAGFSTYGEAYLAHLNQTSTMLLFR